VTATTAPSGRTVTLDARREALVFVLVAVSFPLVAALDPAPIADHLLGSGLARVMANAVYYTTHVPAIVAAFAWLAARHPGDHLRIRRPVRVRCVSERARGVRDHRRRGAVASRRRGLVGNDSRAG
jgi:hypothetical protein